MIPAKPKHVYTQNNFSRIPGKQILLYFFLGIFSLLIFTNTKAQLIDDPAFRIHIYAGLDKLYNMEFEAAEKIQKELQLAHPEHPGPYMLKALICWWKIMLSERCEALDDTLLDAVQKGSELNDQFKDKEEGQFDYFFCQFLGQCLKGRVHAIREQWVRSISTMRKCVPAFKYSKERKEENAEYLFMAGLLDYYIGGFPEQYPIIKPFMFLLPKGDKEAGMIALNDAFRVEAISKAEVGYFLSMIYTLWEADYDKSHTVTTYMLEEYPNNTIFQLMEIKVLFGLDRFEEAERSMLKMHKAFSQLNNAFKNPITFADATITSQVMMEVYFYLGKIQMTHYQNPEKALLFFEQSRLMAKFANYSDHESQAAATYFAGKCFDKLGKQELSRTQFEKVIRMDNNKAYKSLAKEALSTL